LEHTITSAQRLQGSLPLYLQSSAATPPYFSGSIQLEVSIILEPTNTSATTSTGLYHHITSSAATSNYPRLHLRQARPSAARHRQLFLATVTAPARLVVLSRPILRLIPASRSTSMTSAACPPPSTTLLLLLRPRPSSDTSSSAPLSFPRYIQASTKAVCSPQYDTSATYRPARLGHLSSAIFRLHTTSQVVKVTLRQAPPFRTQHDTDESFATVIRPSPSSAADASARIPLPNYIPGPSTESTSHDKRSFQAPSTTQTTLLTTITAPARSSAAASSAPSSGSTLRPASNSTSVFIRIADASDWTHPPDHIQNLPLHSNIDSCHPPHQIQVPRLTPQSKLIPPHMLPQLKNNPHPSPAIVSSYISFPPLPQQLKPQKLNINWLWAPVSQKLGSLINW